MKRCTGLVLMLVLMVTPVAIAQTVSEVVDGLGDDGIYVELGLDVDLDDLRTSVESARNGGFGLYVVLLDEDPPAGAAAFADSTLNRLGSGSVLVLSASSEGMASTELDQAEVEAALDAGFEAGGGDEGYVAAVVMEVIGGPSDPGGGGGAGLVMVLVIVGGLVLLVAWLVMRSNKASRDRRGAMVDEARTEIREQLDSLANTILEITDLVSASDSDEDDRHLEEAGITYTAALESYAAAADLASLERISDRLDVARWQLDAASAIAQGREAPPRPEQTDRPVCFFDPTHRDATEMIDIETASGTRTVRVCRADAERIGRGSRPEPRMIEYGGKRVPAPVAPKSHGGGGMDWLETFSILASGAGTGMSYDWAGGRSRGSARRGSGAAPRTPPMRSRAGRSRRRRR